MNLLIAFLTFVMVVNCLLLILLVLIQLPKKEAGAGLAFGASTTDALLGAGSGNTLTTLTKYLAASFMGLVLVLSVLNSRRHQSAVLSVKEQLAKQPAASAVAPVVTPVVSGASQPLQPAAAGATAAPAATGTPVLTPQPNAPLQLQTPTPAPAPAQPQP